MTGWGLFVMSNIVIARNGAIAEWRGNLGIIINYCHPRVCGNDNVYMVIRDCRAAIAMTRWTLFAMTRWVRNDKERAEMTKWVHNDNIDMICRDSLMPRNDNINVINEYGKIDPYSLTTDNLLWPNEKQKTKKLLLHQNQKRLLWKCPPFLFDLKTNM